MNKPWKVILAFAGVFLAGVICGGAWAPRWWFAPERPMGARPGGGPQSLLPRLEKQLKLTEAQTDRIRPIVERMQVETQRLRREGVREFTAAMERMNLAIAAELTPEQRVKLEEMRKKFRERAEHMRREFRERERAPGSGDEPSRGGPPPPPDET